jgi:hypothetical protein
MSSFSFSSSNSSNNATFDPFGTVGSAWMSNSGNDIFENDVLNNEKRQQPAGQRINSAPTKLSNNNKKTNWGQLLSTKKTNNKRKYASTGNKRSASFSLSTLDNNMSGLQVLSPKSKPRTNSKVAEALRPLALDGASSSSANTTTGIINTEKNGLNVNTPKHKRSKSDNSEKMAPVFGLENFLLGTKVLSNRSASALGKLRGSYKCGKCGVPKKGHVCPHELPKETKDATTQCSFDINPKVESAQIRRLVTKLQEKGIITLSKASDAFNVLFEDVKIPVGTYQTTRVEVHQAATGATSSLSPAVSSNANSKPSKQSDSKNGKPRQDKTKAKRRSAKSVKAQSTKTKLIKNKKPATPKRINSLRTFDSIDSNNDDPFAMDMDPTDAFQYGEFDLTADPLTDDKWFGDDIIDENYDEEMSAMLSA